MSICNPPLKLKEFSIIGGDYKEILVHVNNDNGAMLLDDIQLNFSLIDFKNRYGTPIITRACEPSDTDPTAFIVVLYPDDTKDLADKYIYQITVKAASNKQQSFHKQQSFQGIITIDKNINPDAFATSV